jgi:hypothetical protein
MDKKVIKFEELTYVSGGTYNGEEIRVLPRIPASLQVVLINRYLEDYFNPKSNSIPDCRYGFVDAENQLKVSLIESLTDIELKDVDFVTMLASGIFERIIKEVINYAEFKAMLYGSVKIVEREKELRESVNGMLGNLISKISEFADKMNSISPDEMKKIAQDSTELLKKVEESPASSLFTEAAKNKASKVQ